MYTLNIRGVPCNVAHSDDNPGIVRRWTEYGPEIDVRFLCEWGQMQSLAAALLGSVSLNDDGSLARTPPYNLPFAEKLYCTGIGEEQPLNPKLDTTGWVYYKTSMVTATFGALTWQIDGGDSTGQLDPSGLPYTTTKFRVSSEVIQPPQGAYYIGPFGSSAKLAPDAQVGFISPRVEISMTRHWNSRLPLEEALALVGCVNTETVKLANRTFPRGTLLFAGLTNDPRNDPNGFPVQEIEYTFMGRYQIEWNEFLGVDGQYHYLNDKQDGTGEFPFEYVDFSPLFV